jgi:5-(carboxyamino)imidazole ribonucleotide synthase
MVGGGQLARMTQQAAVPLGVELSVLAEAADAPAVAAGARLCLGAPDDPAALRALAAGADVLTFDHEHVPHALAAALAAEGVAVNPPPAAKLLAQDKLHARRTFADAGLPVPRFAHARTVAEVAAFADEAGFPVVLKARLGGYDGRGVHVVEGAEHVPAALRACGSDALVEEHLDLACELAVLIARRPSGATAAYDVVHTLQEDGMCREMVAPAPVAAAVAREAQTLGRHVAERIGAVGILAVELFVTAGGELVVNELALRPHNSGHWTIEGAQTSQFEQHLRAILDWPLGSTALRAPAAATVNVVGRGDADPRARLADALAVRGAHVHLYGKPPRDGRKLGHVTALGATAGEALDLARDAAERLMAA